MTERIAKPVVKNKFWVVEDGGEKVATIQATEDGGCVYVHNEKREHFPSVNILKKQYNIKFRTSKKPNQLNNKMVYGFPISGRAFNVVYDLQRKLAVYSKNVKSRSLYCAGYFIIKMNTGWATAFCPKNITLSRYEYLGPYQTGIEAKAQLKEQQNATS
jgi:hypothetical protein